MSRRTKPALLSLFLLPFLAVVALVAGLTWFKLESRPTERQSTTKINYSISKGQGLNSIGNSLKELGLIRSLPAFRLQVMLSNKAKKIQAGDFALTKSMNLPTIVEALTHGTTDRWVTFLEGWRREEMAQAIVDNFAQNNKDYAFDPDTFLNLTKNLEGHLYPDTYSFPKTATAAAIVNRLTSHFDSQIDPLTNNSGLSNQQALILASLIEREALSDSERPIVAGILIKRLNNGWPLQVDATVQYLKASRDCRILTCDWWSPNITREDLQIASPYNTYLNNGLPPAPISNPSLVSIKAAYSPKDSDYWFYLHDEKGQIRYAKTIEEHNANVAKYLEK